jgi:hypothetical protein
MIMIETVHQLLYSQPRRNTAEGRKNTRDEGVDRHT